MSEVHTVPSGHEYRLSAHENGVAVHDLPPAPRACLYSGWYVLRPHSPLSGEKVHVAFGYPSHRSDPYSSRAPVHMYPDGEASVSATER